MMRLTPQTLKLYKALPEELRDAVDNDIAVRLRALRQHGIHEKDLNQMYIEAIQIAQLPSDAPIAAEPYEPRRNYSVYQSPRNL